MDTEKHKGERIAKRMARAGLCSRRDAESWIAQGRVRVNGKVIDSAALNVVESDKIVVDGKPLQGAEQTRLFLYHKPAGLVTTHKDEQGRETVFETLPPELPRVVSVGRLDLNTEGLLLLTNDGELARFLELPSTAWKRRYRVRVHGRVDEKRLESLKNGIEVDGVRYQSIEASIDKDAEREAGGTNTWLTIVLQEGKNREVRRVMEALGLKVTRLIRTDYGSFTLGKMKRGSVAEVAPKVLMDQVGSYFKARGIKLDMAQPQREGRVEKARSDKQHTGGKFPAREARAGGRKEAGDKRAIPPVRAKGKPSFGGGNAGRPAPKNGGKGKKR